VAADGDTFIDVAGLARHEEVADRVRHVERRRCCARACRPVDWWPRRGAPTANHGREQAATRGGAS
jgi:hypothetical protein